MTPETDADSGAAAVVLAGGDSTRYGDENKILATVRERPMIDRVVRAVESAVGGPSVVAFRSRKQRVAIKDALSAPERIRFVRDDPGFAGPLAGLYGAVEQVETPWVFVCAGDMPLLSPTAVSWILAHSHPDADAIVPVNRAGRYEPLHAAYRTDAVLCRQDALAPTDGICTLLDSLPESVELPVTDGPRTLTESLTNVNTRDELAVIEGAPRPRH